MISYPNSNLTQYDIAFLKRILVWYTVVSVQGKTQIFNFQLLFFSFFRCNLVLCVVKLEKLSHKTRYTKVCTTYITAKLDVFYVPNFTFMRNRLQFCDTDLRNVPDSRNVSQRSHHINWLVFWHSKKRLQYDHDTSLYRSRGIVQ